MCSRASRRVKVRRSFWEMACWSWPLVSSSFSSRVRTRFGRVLHAAAQAEHFFLEHLGLVPEFCHLTLVGGDPGVRFGVAHWGTSFVPGLRT